MFIITAYIVLFITCKQGCNLIFSAMHFQYMTLPLSLIINAKSWVKKLSELLRTLNHSFKSRLCSGLNKNFLRSSLVWYLVSSLHLKISLLILDALLLASDGREGRSKASLRSNFLSARVLSSFVGFWRYWLYIITISKSIVNIPMHEK